MKNVVFVTGTDTGVGKTVLTALLVKYARFSGIDAVALKPFCTGSRDDARILQAAQGDALDIDTINPWFFIKPLAPYAASKKLRDTIILDDAVEHIKKIAQEHRLVFVEGVGGLMVPVSKNCVVLDIIKRINPVVVVVARNKLGVLNHTFLTLFALRKCGVKRLIIVFVDEKKPDLSSKTNPKIAREFFEKVPIFRLFYVREQIVDFCQDKKVVKKLKKILAQILDSIKFHSAFR